MSSSNLSYRCYILPIIAAIVYYIFSIPIVDRMFHDWIPNNYYNIMVKGLLLLIILFLCCRAMDIIWSDPCHDKICSRKHNNYSENHIHINEYKIPIIPHNKMV